jgi:phosphoribosylformylglycinamidine synthase
LNFGNPERPEIMWEFVESIRGLGAACLALEAPIVSGNVSLYNETGDSAIKPTPSVAVVGRVEDVERVAQTAFAAPGLEIALLGRLEGEDGASLAGSAYLQDLHGVCAGRPPEWVPEDEIAVQGACRELVRAGRVTSAHDLSEGGLAVALAEMAFGGPGWTPVGCILEATPQGRLDQLLFGEDPARILVAYEPASRDEVHATAGRHGAPFAVLGTTGGDRMVIRDATGRVLVDASLTDLAERWETGLERAVGL